MDRNTLTYIVSAGMVCQLAALPPLPVSAPLHDAACVFDRALWPAGSATSTPDEALCIQQQRWSSAGGQEHAAGVLEDASPLSSNSRFMQLQGAGSITPSSVESYRLIDQQQAAGQQQQERLAAFHWQQQHQHQKQVVLQRTAAALPGGKHPSTAYWVRQHQQQQQQLVPQSSSGSITSTNSINSSLAVAGSTNCSSSGRLALYDSGSFTSSSSGGSGNCLKRSAAAFALEQQQPVAKRAATRSTMATMLHSSAGAAASSQTASQQTVLQQGQQQQQQQQLLLLQLQMRHIQQCYTARLPPSGLVKQQQQQLLEQQRLLQKHKDAAATLALASGPATALSKRYVVDGQHCKMLSWAGRILSCQLQDAYLLASHIYGRVTGRLDDMLLVSLGVTSSTESVTMLVSLWVATKLEGHRRQVAGASKLAAALQLVPGAIMDVELHVMQLLQWQPYAGWPTRILAAA